MIKISGRCTKKGDQRSPLQFLLYNVIKRKSINLCGNKTGERCSPLHINSVFTPFVGDGVLDVPLVSDFFNKLWRPEVAPTVSCVIMGICDTFTAVRMYIISQSMA